jgi:cyclophilin family peptidyl-prolyl cis-trans isomerase
VWGQVIEGMEFVDNIKLGSSSDNGSVDDPDMMIKVSVGKAEKSKSASGK